MATSNETSKKNFETKNQKKKKPTIKNRQSRKYVVIYMMPPFLKGSGPQRLCFDKKFVSIRYGLGESMYLISGQYCFSLSQGRAIHTRTDKVARE